VEVSNAAHEARQKAKEQMAALKVQAEQEQQNFEQEWSELGKLIQHDAKMKDFVKQRSRAAAKGLDATDEEEHLRKRIMHTNPSITKDKAAQQQALEKVHKYEEAFARIQTATGITDIDELVATFIEAEDHNFSLFNYVNELNNEVRG
jgi:predicted helicase